MKVLQNIFSESREYYIDIQKRIEDKISQLPKGSVKEREISGKKYYYLQKREGKRVVHEYLGKEKPEALMKQISQRRALQEELKQARKAVQILSKVDKKL